MTGRRMEQRRLALIIVFAFLFNAIVVSANNYDDDIVYDVDDDKALKLHSHVPQRVEVVMP